MFPEKIPCQFKGFPFKKRFFTFPAEGLIRQLVFRHPVHGMAAPANQRMGLIHHYLLKLALNRMFFKPFLKNSICIYYPPASGAGGQPKNKHWPQ
jgi:hypothetical protein